MSYLNRHQRGASLFTALIFLLALSLFAAASFKASTTNLRVVGNTQARQEAHAAAQRAIDQTISSEQFSTAPALVAAAPVAVDIDGDGTQDYTANLTPQPSCYKIRPKKSTELNPGNAADVACIRSALPLAPGIESAAAPPPTGNSLCADTEWNITANVTDARTQAVVTINQGVAVRVNAVDADTKCL